MHEIAFLLYDNRSGSTLLAALLNRYRGVSVSLEFDFVFQILEYPGAVGSPSEGSVLLDYLEGETRFPLLGIDRGELESRVAARPGGWSGDNVLRSVLELYFENRDPEARIRVVKSPRVYYHLDRLRRVFPGMRIIHVVRDGRAVFSSKVRSISSNGRVMSDNLVHAARTWTRKLSIVEAWANHAYTIRYEDLVTHPDPTIEGLLDWLNVELSDRVTTKRQEDYAEQIPADHQHVHTNVARRPDATRAASWMQTMEPAEIRLYERLAGRALARYGYTVTNQHMSTAAAAADTLRLIGYRLHLLGTRVLALFRVVFVKGSLGRLLRAKRYERAAIDVVRRGV